VISRFKDSNFFFLTSAKRISLWKLLHLALIILHVFLYICPPPFTVRSLVEMCLVLPHSPCPKTHLRLSHLPFVTLFYWFVLHTLPDLNPVLCNIAHYLPSLAFSSNLALSCPVGRTEFLTTPYRISPVPSLLFHTPNYSPYLRPI
jgi:hypothetical protein